MSDDAFIARRLLLASALGGLLALTGAVTASCRSHANKTGAMSAEKRYGGQLVIPVYGSGFTRSSLDPAGQSFVPIASQIFETLARRGDPFGEVIEPSLAESWETSSDGLIWRFHLRAGASFHDDECFPGGRGRELRAEDVVYSWQRLIASKQLPAGFQVFGRFIAGGREFHDRNAQTVSGLQAIDDRTLEVRLVAPFVGFLRAVTWFPTSIVPREAVEHYGDDFPKHPVGTGPFRLIEWDVNRRVVIARHPRYWGRENRPPGRPLPFLDAIEYVLYPDALTAFQSVINGQSDMAPVPSAAVDTITEREGASGEFRLREEYARRGLYLFNYLPDPYADYLCFNMNGKTPFARDARLRRAVGYVIQPPGAAPQCPLLRPLPGVPQPRGEGFYYDAERARALLREAGYAQGRGLPKLRLLLLPQAQANERAGIRALQRELGLKIEEVVIPAAEMDAAVREGNFDLLMDTWEFFYPDPTPLLERFQSDAPPEDNIARYRNPRFDALFAEMIGEQNKERRASLITEIEDLLLKDAAWIVIANQAAGAPSPVMMRRSVHLANNAEGRINLSTVWLDQADAPAGRVAR